MKLLKDNSKLFIVVIAGIAIGFWMIFDSSSDSFDKSLGVLLVVFEFVGLIVALIVRARKKNSDSLGRGV